MFKQLDKKGRNASILFKFADFLNFGEEIFDRINNEFPEIFNFDYIPSQMKTFIYHYMKQTKMKKDINMDEFAIKVFNDKSDNVRIPDNLNSICFNLFYAFNTIVSLTFPSSLESIGNSAFEKCYSLQKVIFAGNSRLKSIGDFLLETIEKDAFNGCTELTSINIPFNVKTIEQSPFNGCKKIKLEINQKNSSKPFVFYDFATKNFSIPPFFESIKQSVFYSFLSLTKIVIPSSIKEIEDHTFEKCHSLTSVIFEEESQLKSIGSFAFSECSNLEKIEMPSLIKTIGDYCFAKCSSLASINFSDKSNIENIGSHCFSECSKLEKIEIPSSLKKINDSLFEKCSLLAQITFLNKSCLESIGKSAFFECSKLEEIKIPSSVIIIDCKSFFKCSSLKSVIFEEESRLQEICEYAFYNCGSLSAFNIPQSVIYIKERAFQNCKNLKHVNIPPSIESIGYSAFGGASLNEVEVPLSVKRIDGYAFIHTKVKRI